MRKEGEGGATFEYGTPITYMLVNVLHILGGTQTNKTQKNGILFNILRNNV